MPAGPPRPARLLIVLPSWVGDCVMATPALRALRRALPGSLIGALIRPGLEGLLDGSNLFDELHLDRPVGMMGPKRVAARLRALRYDTTILFANSFSAALITRLAGIPRRIGYDRDARGLLLTDRLTAPLRRDTPPFDRSTTAPHAWAPIPACEYYFSLARRLLELHGRDAGPMGPMELAVSPEAQAFAACVWETLPRNAGAPIKPILLNPGGNNPAKRWPAQRFAELAAVLEREHGSTVLISGDPAEAELTAGIAAAVPPAQRPNVVDLVPLLTQQCETTGPNPTVVPAMARLKALVARCSLIVTNDTGPRHIAAALGVPVVSLFGPTDPRWTAIPFAREAQIRANPSLAVEEVADDHPDLCSIERIPLEAVVEACQRLIG